MDRRIGKKDEEIPDQWVGESGKGSKKRNEQEGEETNGKRIDMTSQILPCCFSLILFSTYFLSHSISFLLLLPPAFPLSLCLPISLTVK